MLILDHILLAGERLTDNFIFHGELAGAVETIIADSPRVLNCIRDMNIHYSSDTVLDILYADAKIIQTRYKKLELFIRSVSDN